jgi:hypothetical protein
MSYELSVVPSDHDARTRPAASRNVDLEMRYVIACVGACCRRGGGKRDDNKHYVMRRMVLQYRVERVLCYKYGRYRHRCR